MSYACEELVWQTRGLGAACKLVLLALAKHARSDGTHAFPALARLEQLTAISQRHVQRQLRTLRERQLVRVEAAADRARHRPTSYALNITALLLLTPGESRELVKARFETARQREAPGDSQAPRQIRRRRTTRATPGADPRVTQETSPGDTEGPRPDDTGDPRSDQGIDQDPIRRARAHAREDSPSPATAAVAGSGMVGPEPPAIAGLTPNAPAGGPRSHEDAVLWLNERAELKRWQTPDLAAALRDLRDAWELPAQREAPFG